jgi:hypothetical protein
MYHFDLNENRTSLLLDGPVKDKIADNIEESKNIIFGSGFGGITDLEIGRDGYLYVLSLDKGGDDCDSDRDSCLSYSSEEGAVIMRIVPRYMVSDK